MLGFKLSDEILPSRVVEVGVVVVVVVVVVELPKSKLKHHIKEDLEDYLASIFQSVDKYLLHCTGILEVFDILQFEIYSLILFLVWTGKKYQFEIAS